MPVHHTKDIPYVSYRTWYTLTTEEKDALISVFDEVASECTTARSELRVGKGVGPGAAHGTTLSVPVFSNDPEFPDDFFDTLEETVVDAGIASRVQRVSVPRDPAGEAFHPTDDHKLTYRALVRVHGSWNTVETVEH